MLVRVFIAVIAINFSLVAAPKQSISVVTTQNVNFAAGGAIRVTGWLGQVNIEGWDRSEVQIELTRSLFRDDTPAIRERAKRELDAIRIQADQPSPGELAISTTFPKRKFFPVSILAKIEVDLNYRIMVPRNSKLEIHHGSGDVTIYDVSGDMQVHLRSGDILAQLPQPGIFNIDARTGIGTVYTDFDGATRAPFLVGQRFAGTTTGAARQITFRTGVGGISILQMSAPVYTTGTGPN